MNLYKPDLFGELLLTQLVESEEFLGEHNVLEETAAGELHTDDDSTVRDHHGYCAEVDLQILWQFLSAGVARVLCKHTHRDDGKKRLKDNTSVFILVQRHVSPD